MRYTVTLHTTATLTMDVEATDEEAAAREAIERADGAFGRIRGDAKYWLLRVPDRDWRVSEIGPAE